MKSEQNSFLLSVIGLGYIGIPTAAFFARGGVNVLGIDINERIVNKLNQGEIAIEEPKLPEIVFNAVKSGKLKASVEPKEADAFIIAVPTPFKGDHVPDLKYIESAAISISKVLKKGNLVVLESTSPVGTTEYIQKIFKEHTNLNVEEDIYLAYAPERMIPGNVFELIENDRIIGGINPKSSQKAKELYSKIVKGSITITDSRTAEMAKLTENSFRDVNIAFANELSMICDKLNINVHELIEIANHHPRVNILSPGCGVGGHCIAVDPWFIVNKTPEYAKLIHSARCVNDYKPDFVIEKVQEAIDELKIPNPSITCFGLTFKPNIDDLRESPALYICEKLSKMYSKVSAVEPNIKKIPEKLSDKGIKLVDIKEGLKSNILLLLVEHKEFREIKPEIDENIQKIVDTRGIWL